MLMEAEADVNARSDDGESPLHCAAFQGHAEISRALVCGGAQVDTVARKAASVSGLKLPVY